MVAWFNWLGMPAEIRCAAYNQIFQQLLDPFSLVRTNQNGTNIFLICIDDWAQVAAPEAARRHAEEFLRTIEHFSSTSSSQTVVCMCPSSRSLPDSRCQTYASIESLLLESFNSNANVISIGSTAIETLYPVVTIDDELAKRAGHIPYTPEYFTALASYLVRRLTSLRRPLAKVIALDCDNTLWDGVCGEVGSHGVEITEERLAFQHQLLQLRDAGFLLCLCSKNNPQDAWAVFDDNPHMLLKRQHITAAQFHWNAKSRSLRELASQLKLGVDSFVFLDDNPLEIAEVRAHAPEVLALQLPEHDSHSQFLRHIWALDRWSITAEDRRRADQYTQEHQREELRENAPSLEQFLRDLDLQVEFLPLTIERLERAAQLTQRTNQFNFTTHRRSVSEMRQVLDSSSQHAFLVRAADKFGDYGLVGLVVYEVNETTLQVDTLLLSCRALGRRIELQILAKIAGQARQHGRHRIVFEFVKTEKNQPAAEFVDRYLEQYKTSDYSPTATVRYTLDARQLDSCLRLATLGIANDDHASTHDTASNSRAVTTNTTDASNNQPIAIPQLSELYNHIASDLNRVEKIQCKLRSEARPRPAMEEAYSAPRTEVEQRVTAICQEVLHLAQVGVRDGLKNLGASSLHIVQIYSSLEREFAAGLSITDLFALPNIEAIVRLIESRTANRSSLLTPSVSFTAINQQSSSTADNPSAPRHDPNANLSSGIAVIGMAGRFPGASNVREFWDNVTRGVCSIVEIPDNELNLPLDSPLRQNPNLVRKAASVKDADKFDAKFFGIFPKEATVMDPQHRLFLESCWHAIEDAGYNADAIDGPVGVFAGCYMDTYILASLALSPKWIESLANAFHGGDLLTELGNDKDYLATRVSFLLNLRGPAITVQTACSTSLVAISQACQSLVSGQCSMALAGGVTLKLPQNRGYLYTEGGMVSPDGVCRTFDARARGTVFGEGCGVVMLKRVEDALADGDDIYAVIKGWGLNNDGHTKLGYTAPSVEGQAGAIEMAHLAAGFKADSITLMEAHGTGTALGDPIEIESLTRVFRKTTDKKQFCAIGSAKTNIGHLDVAAGVTGLIKTSLALRHRVLPPSLNFEQPNPNIDFPNSPFYVNTQLRQWSTPAPRRAALSSFGVGGTNAHVVLEEAPQLPATSMVSGPQLLTLSAKSQAALDAQRAALIEHLKAHPQLDLADVAYTLSTGRKTFNYNLVTVATDVQQAIHALASNDPQQIFQQRQLRRGKSVVFLFPGQGSQHLDMARDLFESDDVFRKHFDNCADLLLPHLGFDLREKIYGVSGERAATELNQTAVAQASIFSVSYALAKRWETAGITPRIMIGHSVGEFVAACLAGVFTLEDTLRLVAFRAAAMQRLPKGSMLAVRLGEADLSNRLPSELSIAAINGPLLCVVSGPSNAIEKLQTNLEAEDIVCQSLHTSHAFHSAMMDDVVQPFAEQLQQVTLNPPRIPIVSSVTGQPLSDAQAVDPWYWARHLRETVRFTDALSLVAKDPDSVLLEVGPGQTLSTLARQHPDRDSELGVFSTLPHAKQQTSARDYLLLTIGRLWLAGVNVNWNCQFHSQRRRRLHLPGYPFERQRYWLEADVPSLEEPSVDLAGTETVPDLNAGEFGKATETLLGGCTPKSEDNTPPLVGTDAMMQRVIRQQLQLMREQLEAWPR